MTPLGLHHIMGAGHHFGPGPWVSKMSRADWTSTYYHKAVSTGIGFDRTKTGSDAIRQYHRIVARTFESPDKCPQAYLLWFHHLEWQYLMPSGNTLWDEICLHYQEGVSQVEEFAYEWESLRDYMDQQRFKHVAALLKIQLKEARWWRDSCIRYFQSFSQLPLPEGVPEPEFDLDYYQALTYPYAPGIRPRW
jgi:alpha-glucuronidase